MKDIFLSVAERVFIMLAVVRGFLADFCGFSFSYALGFLKAPRVLNSKASTYFLRYFDSLLLFAVDKK